jgi:MFS family permease
LNNRLRVGLERKPLLTAVAYTGLGVLPLFLVSTQVLQLDREIDFGVGRLGLATAAFFGAAALAANPAGRLVARLGSGAGLRIGSAVTVASCILAAVAPVWWAIPLAVAVGGVGNGFIQVSSNIAIFNGVRKGRQGFAFGAKQASVPTASILAGLSLPAVGLVFGWRWVFVGAALLALMFALSVPHLDRNRPPTREERAPGRIPSILWLGIAGLAGAAAGNGLSLFIVPSAVDVGIEEAAAGAVLAACSLLVVILRVSAGLVVDRRGSSGHAEMAIMATVGAVGAFALTAATSPPLYLVAMPIALLGAWGWPGIIFFTVVNTYPEFPAKASGMILSFNLTGTLIGPLVVGALAERGNYPGAWIFVSVCSAIAAVGFFAAKGSANRIGVNR